MIFYMVVGRRQSEYFFPAICKISDLTWVEGDLAAPFHVFLINTGGGGTVKVDPADRPEIVGTFVIVFIFTIQQGILLSQIGERAAAGEHHEKKVGGKIGMGTGVGPSGVNLSDLLQVE